MASRLAALLCSVLVSVVSCVLPAQAQSWPTRAVRFIIPFAPGAGADIGARLIQERLQKRWGQPVVIENRPGGDSMIAIQGVLSANDDHTLLWSPSGNFIAHPHLYLNLPYDPNDLIPIAQYSQTILAMAVPAAMNVKDVSDLVARAKEAPGKLNSAAVPGVTELAFDYFLKSAGVTTVRVPYKNIVQAATDLGEDRLQIAALSYAMMRPQHTAGLIKPLAIMSAKRAPGLDIPSAIEAGYPSLVMEGLIGLFGTKAVSPAVREKIGTDVVAVSRDKEIADKLSATAQVLNPGDAQTFTESIRLQRAQIDKIASELAIKPTR
ncbi:MAG: tripartite tricarboxylate transporter substrate binding protein [Hyphomicrobiales bacterium]|nr:tripartite tricarboxylate transporter substrate binding protein [Hyphomicrobiales bacterium]